MDIDTAMGQKIQCITRCTLFLMLSSLSILSQPAYSFFVKGPHRTRTALRRHLLPLLVLAGALNTLAILTALAQQQCNDWGALSVTQVSKIEMVMASTIEFMSLPIIFLAPAAAVFRETTART